ncbi:hypothetical protein LC040_18835 [Bacillus tianshenii]|nr:hypothetical protein LC040_18835 [Bacillus tianshenii]
MMKTINFQVNDEKHLVHLTATRLAIYNQCKIIEATNDKNESYYLFFYKDTFLTGKKTDAIKIRSTVSKAFKTGIVFSTPHPFIDRLLSQHRMFKFSTFNQLHSRLKKDYSPQEIAFIFTFFDTYIKKAKIAKLIQTNFYHHRRDGQLLRAYQVLNLYRWAFPKSKWGTEVGTNLQYKKYAETYSHGINTLFKKDPLFAEIDAFRHREQPKPFESLISLYKNENRLIDLLALHIDRLMNSATSETFSTVMRLLHEHTNTDEQTEILQAIYDQQSHIPELQKSLFDHYLFLNKNEAAINLLIQSQISITPSQEKRLRKLFLKNEIDISTIEIERCNHLIIQLFKDNPDALEEMVRACVEYLFKTKTIHEIEQWLLPFQEAEIHLSLQQKIANMVKIHEDPEQQSMLGELYCEFQQFNKAIECYKWEMELKPTDPTPVKSLTNLYQSIGESEEAKAYQQILMTMGK